MVVYIIQYLCVESSMNIDSYYQYILIPRWQIHQKEKFHLFMTRDYALM